MTRGGGWWRRAYATLTVLALIAAACGDGDAEAGPAGDPEQTTITIGALPLVDFAPLFYAEEMGMFDDEGLDATIEVVQGGPVAAQLLLAGDIQFSFNNWLSVAAAVGNDAPLVIVANATHLGDGQGGVFVTADSPIQTLADLDGKNVAVNTTGNVGDITVEAVARDEGLDLNINWVEVGFPETIPAIESGSVDAGFLTEPFTTFAKLAGLRSIADPYSQAAKNLPIAGYVSTQEFAAANPNTVAAFRRAIERATRELLEDEDTLREFIPTYSAVPADAAAVLVLPEFQTTLRNDDFQRAADLMTELGYLDEKLDASQYVING